MLALSAIGKDPQMQRLTTITTIHAGDLQHEHRCVAARHRLAATASTRRNPAGGLRSPLVQLALVLVLALAGAAAVAGSADASAPAPATSVPSPMTAGQPGLVGEEWSPLLEAARDREDLPEPPGGEDLSMQGGTGGICPTADACWIDGVGTYQYFPNCIVGGYGYVYSYVGYWGKDDFSYPQVGQRYWGHLVSGVVGSACGGEYIGTDIELPVATGFDLDGTAEGKIRCFYTSGNTGNTEEITNHSDADCRQNPGAGVHGGYGLGGRIIPAYGTFEVIFPIRSTQQNLGTSRMTAAVDTALSSPKVAYPDAMVAVTPGAGPDPDPGPGPGPDPDPDPGPGPGPGPDPDPDPDPTPRATPLTAQLKAAGKKLKLSGTTAAARAGDAVEVTLARSAKKGKPFRAIGEMSAAVGSTGAFNTAFKRPKKGKCKATLSIAAEAASGYQAATKTVTGKC
jgi:hypothetical protein